MSITVYGIANCDSCRKARRWLDAHHVEHAFHDVRADGLDAGLVRRWREQVAGTDLVNRRSRSWRELDEAARRQADTDPDRLLAGFPLLLKRPLLETPQGILAGFREAEWTGVLGLRA